MRYVMEHPHQQPAIHADHRGKDAPESQDAASPAVLAHEMNNLLDGSLRSLGLALRALRDVSAEDETRDVIDRLESADQLMKRMVGLVHTLGNTPAPQTYSDSKQTAAPAPNLSHTLGEALDHALQSVSARADDQGITVAAVADPELTDAPADALYTVLSNGLKNALESIALRRELHDDANGSDRVEVRLEQDEGDVVLAISDTGAGLDKAVIEAGGAFKFGVSTKPSGQGIGMGLCRQVAQALGGAVSLRNRVPRGAVLTLRFPRSSLCEIPGEALR